MPVDNIPMNWDILIYVDTIETAGKQAQADQHNVDNEDDPSFIAVGKIITKSTATQLSVTIVIVHIHCNSPRHTQILVKCFLHFTLIQ